MKLRAPRARPLLGSSRRPLRLEMLEDRSMLSLPTVTDVNVADTDWTADFVDYLETSELGTDGYSIPVGSSEQTKTLPWLGIDQVRIKFSEDVDVQQSDLSLSGVNTTAYEFASFSYDSSSYTAVWTLTNNITNDNLLLDLDGDGLDPVKDLDESNTLDGEWTDESSTYPSGNGTAGGDFEFRFSVVGGDVDGNGGVNVSDAGQVLANVGKQAGDTGYNIRHDVDGDAAITYADFTSVRAVIGRIQPSGDPAGVNNDAPTTSGIADVTVDEDADNVTRDVYAAFDDAEDEDNELTYEVDENTDPDLFDSLYFDGYGGLVLDFADDAFGDAEITVKVTDTGGLFVTTTFDVTVNPVNDAPVITDFVGVQVEGDFWSWSGVVTDVDDDVEGLIVVLGGILEPYNVTATVLADGTFSLTDDFPDLPTGTATAQTEDCHGALSNIAWYAI